MRFKSGADFLLKVLLFDIGLFLLIGVGTAVMDFFGL